MKNKPSDIKERFEKYVVKQEGCWKWLGHKADGYGRFFMKKINGQAIKWPAPRVAWMLYKGPIPPGMCVCHHCDNPECTNPEHLWLGTNADNLRDMWLKGRARGGSHPGEKNPSAKLSEKEVIEIRYLYKTSMHSTRQLSKRFNISRSMIQFILHGKAWSHL